MNRLNLTTLETRVLDSIEKVYNCKYIKPLKVTKEQSRDIYYYELQLFLYNDFFDPFIIGVQCNNDDEFITFIEKDLKERQLTRRKQYGLVRYDNEES
jgi:hypothetical protein